MIRLMRREDVSKVAYIERESFSDPWSEKMFYDLIDSPAYKSFVLIINDEISGYMSVIATKYVLEIINIAVKREQRNHGFGYMLIEKAKELAREMSADTIYLEVRKSNEPAKNLYLKAGFIFDGERKGYYADGEDALLLSCKVEG